MDLTKSTTSGDPTQSDAPSDRGYLSVRDLCVHFPTPDGVVKAVDGLSFDVPKGKTLGIVGESGSGKSVTSQTIMGLQRHTKARVSGSIELDGQELTSLNDAQMRKLLGNKLAMIFQDPLSAMHPYYTVGAQIIEAIRVHHPEMSKAKAKERTVDLLARVGIPNPKDRVDRYPHEFSGGMRQRAMIAMALANDPSLLIADEPTTALDVTVQAQILELMHDLQEEFGSTIIVITHDLGVVAEMADEVLVMYAGKCVERGPLDDIFYRPMMPYTWGLLSSMPRMDRVKAERLQPVPGSPPSLINVPSGCAFNPRCAFKDNVPGGECTKTKPDLTPVAPGHVARCLMTVEQREQIFASQIKPAL